PYPVNPAGFVIHSAVHEAREDAATRSRRLRGPRARRCG
ncbi:MAG: class II aldolase, partial [Betaproteobacteria bacterium]|nr:class II aldolase [Betaproteobacteria bacterium]